MVKICPKGNEIEIVLRSGERISCTPSHRFPTTTGMKETSALCPGDVLLSCRLPAPDSPLTNILDDDAAWFAGLYIAEGSRHGEKISIAGHVKETGRWKRAKQIAEKFSGTATLHEYGNKQIIRVNGTIVNAILDELVTGRTAKDKGLAPVCWRHDDDFLRSLLFGYLGGDGHNDIKNNRWRLGFMRNYNLERDIRTMCARLGYQLTLNLASVLYEGKPRPTFRGEIRIEASSHLNAKSRCEIMEIRKARCREVYDIGVTDEPHLFSLASGILTHNSKPNPMPESVTDRCTKAHEYIFLLSKGQWKSRVIKFSDLNGKVVHLGKYLGVDAPYSWGCQLCVRLASAIFDFAQGKENFSLPPFYAQEWKQLPDGSDSDFVRCLPPNHIPAVWASRFLDGNATAEQFLKEMNRLRVTLRNGNDLLKGGVAPVFLNTPSLYTDSEGTITIHDSGKISKIDVFHDHIIASAPTTCKYYYDAEAVKERSTEKNWQSRYERAEEGQKSYPTEKRNGIRSRADSFKREGSKREQAIPGQTKGTHRPDRKESDYPLDTRNRRSVWTITTKPFRETHFATFPPEIPEICIKAGTSERGCCPECGNPWVRMVEGRWVKHPNGLGVGTVTKDLSQHQRGKTSSFRTGGSNVNSTTG